MFNSIVQRYSGYLLVRLLHAHYNLSIVPLINKETLCRWHELVEPRYLYLTIVKSSRSDFVKWVFGRREILNLLECSKALRLRCRMGVRPSTFHWPSRNVWLMFCSDFLLSTNKWRHISSDARSHVQQI